MQPIQDERQGATSASNAEADALCPGRHLAQAGLPDETGADAASGNRIHEWLAGQWQPGNAPELASEEHDLAVKCREIEKQVASQVFSGNEKDCVCIRETRMWHDFDGLKHSGKPDVLLKLGKVGMVLDYKTGRNEVAQSPRNLQLRDLAALAALNHNLSVVHVCIIQPWATLTPEVCTYDKRDLLMAVVDMERRVTASNAPNAPRVPGGKQCKYCKAKAHCKEAMAQVVAIAKSETISQVSKLDAEGIARFLEAAAVAEDIIDAVKSEAKRRLTAGESVPGYTLKAGAVRESITDAQECFNRCAAKGVALDGFMSAVTIAKGKLKDAVKTATGEKGKALDAMLTQILDGITEEKQAAPSLAKI